jgi:hypothetical protein
MDLYLLLCLFVGFENGMLVTGYCGESVCCCWNQTKRKSIMRFDATVGSKSKGLWLVFKCVCWICESG